MSGSRSRSTTVTSSTCTRPTDYRASWSGRWWGDAGQVGSRKPESVSWSRADGVAAMEPPEFVTVVVVDRGRRHLADRGLRDERAQQHDDPADDLDGRELLAEQEQGEHARRHHFDVRDR